MEALYLIIIIPIAVFTAYIVSLIEYKAKKKKLELSENEEDLNKLKNKRVFVCISGIISLVLIIILVIMAVLFFFFLQGM